MDGLREVSPVILCLVGAPETDMVERAAWWYGQNERYKATTDHLGRQSQQSEKADTLHSTDLLLKSVD
ncbi:hypothetical protein [Zhihengliuella salsuginis]|uniref:Uncharacterized protein n=1 Tax=Zhihengliuella salsuginis TaxID=578222 RepID=A0ABQ3GFU2_9MICC|nr:hypothetical protein [Zhihengliuella salsuginis]GHD04367.1 hypothetical protein GCM10008096_11610 [Zhihengliuella salsuginis]